MISGSRLRSMMAFQADVVRNEIARTSRRLLGLDRDLNMLRAEEAVAWKDYARDPAEGEASAPENARKVIEIRHARALEAIDELGSAEIEIAAVSKPLVAARQEAMSAKAAFEAARAEATDRWISSAERAGADRMEAAAAARLKEIASWESTASSALGIALRSISSDPVLAYLSKRGWGTASYKGGFLAKKADAWAARKSGYGAAADACAALRGYLASCEEWRVECRTARARAAADKILGDERVLESLYGPRAELANALNALHALETRTAGLVERRDSAMAALLEIVHGKDQTYRVMVDAFARAMSDERSKAIKRMADLGIESPDGKVGERIDAIVAERIRLSIETDGLRKHVAQAVRRLDATVRACEAMDRSGWSDPSVEFGLDEDTFLPQDVAGGRLTVDEAVAELESALGRTAPVPVSA